MNPSKRKVILDTDVGVDDAMALLFLYFAKDSCLEGIVTGYGNASIENTTRNTLFLTEKFGIDVPVYRGAAHPLDHISQEAFPHFIHGHNGLGDIDVSDPVGQVGKMSGSDAIVAIARKYPQQVSIVAIGRLTNMAEALVKCPELPSLVQEVVIMGGAFGFNGHRGNATQYAEANIWGDPVAAKQVLGSGLQITAVGLDVTMETIAGREFFELLSSQAGVLGEFLVRLNRNYIDHYESYRGSPGCAIHDSTAVAYFLRPEFFKTVRGAVNVETDGAYVGRTTFHELPSSSVRVCTAVDDNAVLKLISSTIIAADVDAGLKKSVV